jgi:LIVCS family branched-chain amino acid:cation transporter
MNKTKEIFVVGFALFSMFFGAGNLILPPSLGYNGGEAWLWIAIGFILTAVVIPIFGIMAHAKLQGSIFHFGVRVSPMFSWIYCIAVFIIAVTLPIPRTAAVTHELAVEPFLGTSALLTSCVYFSLVFLTVLFRAKIVEFLGKWLTPLIGIILLVIIGIGISTDPGTIGASAYEAGFITGLLEGYQTYDAIGSLIAGGVIIVSLKLYKDYEYSLAKSFLRKAGFVAGLGLFIFYAGLILVGALFSSELPVEASRTEVLSGISLLTLGNIGATSLAVLVALACFTTAVGVILGTADFFKELFNNSITAYYVTALIACVLGILVGQLNVGFIITIGIPVLMLLYPVTIILIMLNIMPNKLAGKNVFRAVVFVSLLFSIPDAVNQLFPEGAMSMLTDKIPLAQYHVGWLLPALVTFVAVNYYNLKRRV